MPDTPRNPNDFRTTRWTLVGEAGDPNDPAHDAALAGLLDLYRPALLSHLVRRKRMDPDKADDLLQEFVLKKILQYNLMKRADKSRGKFRTLLLTALDNFARNRARGGPGVVELAEGNDPVDEHCGPDETFDIPWARQMIQETLRQMKIECDHAHRADVWGVFDARILGPMLEAREPAGYQELVDRFKLQSPAQASNLLITAKRMFERTMREVIGQYAPEDEIDAEIAELREILSKGAESC